jgi:transglutaminase-like putative cysteine protease
LQIEIEHRLRFDYDAYVRESFMELRVEPPSGEGQRVLDFQISVGPQTRVGRYVDWNGNRVHFFGVGDYHDRIEVLTHALIETGASQGWDPGESRPPEPAAGPQLDFVAFGGPVCESDALRALEAELSLDPATSAADQIRAIGHHLFERFEYRPGVTDYRSTLDAILAGGGGVCQDFAHLMIGVLRLRGIPARYVSGYLHVDRDRPEPSQSHAWVEAHAGGDRWLAFDPTHDCPPDEGYVRVARGRHYDDVPPNRGLFRGSANETLHSAVHTRVRRGDETGRLQKDASPIDVPVYRELPAQPAAPSPSLPIDDEETQQQQQQ